MYKGNPIRVEDEQGQFVRFYPLSLSSEAEPLHVTIQGRNGLCFDGYWTSDVFLTLLVSGYYSFCYRNTEGDILLAYERGFQDGAVIVDASDATRWIDDQRFRQIEQTVIHKMENYQVSEDELEHHTQMMKDATKYEAARRYVTGLIRQLVQQMVQSSEAVQNAYVERIYAHNYGMGVIQSLDDDPKVGEIIVNATLFPTFCCRIKYVKDQVEYEYGETFQDVAELKKIFNRAIAFAGKEINSNENAIVEAIRANRDRVSISVPAASEQYVLNIRKFTNFIPTRENMRRAGTVPEWMEELFDIIVKGKANVGIGGVMGVGKTTMINYAIGAYSDPLKTKAYITAVAEVDVSTVLADHFVIIYNIDDDKQRSAETLKRIALRSSAERIIVPEARGTEFRAVLDANKKIRGGFFTGHGSSAAEFLDSCMEMYADGQYHDWQAIQDKVATGIDFIWIMIRVGSTIRIGEITEVVREGGRFQRFSPLIRYVRDPEYPDDPTKGTYERTDARLSASIRKLLNESGVPHSKLCRW